MSTETTKVIKQEVSAAEFADLLSIPGTDDILTSDEKPSFFSNRADLNFLTPPTTAPKKETPKAPEDKPADPPKEDSKPDPSKEEVTAIIDEVDPDPAKVKEEPSGSGRPKVVKDGLIEATKKLIEKKIIVPFDDDKALEDYTVADYEELIEANFKDKEDRVRKEIPIEFFDSLPEELQYAAKYVADGGRDLKGLFKALGEVQAVRELSEEDPKDHETIVREYLTVTNFGTPEDIQEEITSWKDLNKLAEKAEKFKPKLDQMREEQVASHIARQEIINRQQQEASRNYTNSIYEVLKPAELNGLKLDKKTQGMLYSGLVQSQHTTRRGQPTNLLGHLLEKYQYVEPNHALIAEALWLLSDPEGYRTEVKKEAKNAQVEETVRKLKTEESKKIISSSTNDKEDTRERKIARQSTNFFKR